MAIGLLTRLDGYNFGTSLQAYALATAIGQLGYEVKIIDFCEYSRKFIAWKKMLDFFGRVHITDHYDKFMQRKAFDAFGKSMPITTKKFRGIIPKHFFDKTFEKIVCGSDQIWNPTQVKRTFLLDFVGDNIPKIAYAPSLGLSNCELRFSAEYRSLISRFDFLSCREDDGAKVISNITSRNCETVCDPTLLLSTDEYIKLERSLNISKPFILTYFLGEVENYPISFIKNIAQEYNFEIINIPLYYIPKIYGVRNLRVSPREFIWLLQNASVICTNSYHGTIFSLLFNKLFYLFKRSYKVNNYSESSRFKTLFKRLGCEILPLAIQSDLPPYCTIEYNDINKNIELFKEQSITYLKESLECPK